MDNSFSILMYYSRNGFGIVLSFNCLGKGSVWTNMIFFFCCCKKPFGWPSGFHHSQSSWDLSSVSPDVSIGIQYTWLYWEYRILKKEKINKNHHWQFCLPAEGGTVSLKLNLFTWCCCNKWWDTQILIFHLLPQKWHTGMMVCMIRKSEMVASLVLQYIS